MFDETWNTNGLLDLAAEHIVTWFKKQGLVGAHIEILRENEKAPLIFAIIDAYQGSAEET
jgi:acetylornithine deacetylase/succinyl-diaminopimelate desuccinylase-like protein